jgi:cation diffusion facilitator CzcD-associated flavoprotein CzcO
MGSIGEASKADHDVLVIGAGLSGCYTVYRMRQQKLNVKCIEAGSGVGGTWYWNRYPGARFDSESYTYGFSWSPEILKEWDWTEHFAPQPETERYLNFICDKFGLREDIQFNTRIRSARWLDDKTIWQLTDTDGNTYTSRFLITGMGVLSNPTLPNVPGVPDYKGEAFHTARWPKEPVSFEGKKVGIIGTGATAIQAIPEIAKTVGHLTVFQRTPNWAIPLHNAKISKEEMESIRKGYPELFERCLKTRMCFIHDANPDSIWDASDEQREKLWEELYAQPGFGLWLSNYKEMLVDHSANKLVSDFVAKKIRQRVHNPETADLLVPKGHGFGTRRVPMETFYYEAYNRPNVRLIDLNNSPIEKITEKGLKTTKEDFEFDMLIYATGFDAVTGAFDAIDFEGVDGVKLLDRWSEGPKTYLGMTVQGFPNMFMVR